MDEGSSEVWDLRLRIDGTAGPRTHRNHRPQLHDLFFTSEDSRTILQTPITSVSYGTSNYKLLLENTPEHEDPCRDNRSV